MNYQEYQLLFDAILKREVPSHPYDDDHYLNYVKLNQARMRRWNKQLHISEDIAGYIKSLRERQHWTLITEPWCGDAAHSLPFLIAIAQLNANISYDIQLRDSEPFLINSYLTGGTKSIPKLIVRDNDEQDILVWGPRPLPAQLLVNQLKAAATDYATLSEALQLWYNQDKGESLCRELFTLFNEVSPVQNLSGQTTH